MHRELAGADEFKEHEPLRPFQIQFHETFMAAATMWVKFLPTTSSYSLLVLHHSSSPLLLHHKLCTLSHSPLYSLAPQRLISQTHLERWWISAQKQSSQLGLQHGRHCLKELHYQSQRTGEKTPAGLWFRYSRLSSWKKSHSLSYLPARLSASSLLGMYIKL